MVIGVVAKEVFRQGTKALMRYYRIEGKAFQKLYTGFPKSGVIGRGVRHGLAGGSVVGSLINQAPETPGNGVQETFKRNGTPPRKSYKTRGRRSVRNNRRCEFRPKYRKYY